MAQYNGYVSIPHETYQEWRDATVGNGYNVDGAWGNQCWDYCAELWHQYNLTLHTRAGGGGAADCWLVSRNLNAQNPFSAITGKENIKRGDVIVINRSAYSSTGHICIADEDYNGTDQIRTIGQTPTLHGQNGSVSADVISLTYFLGIFRNNNWEEQPTPTDEEQKKRKFPWAVAWAHWNY